MFLDTNVIIEMADGLLSGDKSHRGTRLFNSLNYKVRDNKIICPFVFQRNEYFTFFDKVKNKKCDDILLSLSKGKQVTIVVENIFRAQFKRMASIYLKNRSSLSSINFGFNEEDIFNPGFNTESDLEKTLGVKLIVLLSGFLYPNQKKVDANLLKLFKKRKKQIQTEKLTKKQVFEEEKRGRLFDLIKSDEDRVNYYKSEINPSGGLMEEASLRSVKSSILKYWKESLNQENFVDRDLSKLKAFINSEYFFSIPVDYISSILFTELLVGNFQIKITDAKDIESLSTIFPYSTVAIIDNEMQSHIYKSNLHEIFNVNVFSLKSTEKFIRSIGTL